ncbi:aldolase/citrate lyase family protein [Streptosporangium fragile]|uniref:Aldolase/citrate lyase family protein n=1 Tax=Streptosporangium fragile TaxID=46186 RepID=A0ABP6INK0_9ACTN
MRVTLADPAALVPGFEQIHREQSALYPYRAVEWQPVHTVYVPADRFGAGTVEEWGDAALGLFRRHLPEEDLAAVFGVDGDVAGAVHGRVAAKLAREPVEDLRVDFEDGYGVRPDAEDGHASAAAKAVAAMHEAGTLPRRWGLRVKSFADGDPVRSIRTLDGFLTEVIERAGLLPEGFVVTFPKVLMRAYLDQFADCLDALEAGLGLAGGTLRFEIQVEAPQTVLFLEAGLVAALRGRLAAAHFGVFDYTASCSLPPHEQRLDHPVCEHARHVMQAVFAGTGVELSDGSLAAAPTSGDRHAVHDLWRRHAELVGHSLSRGFYQGWDMHPSHLVSRYAAVYAFHLSRRAEYARRVRAWQEQRDAGGGVMDEPATVKTMAAALRRADLALGDA